MKVFVSGHKGMVGSAIIRGLKKDPVSWDILVCDRKEVDLCDQSAVEAFLDSENPDMVLNAAGRVGGIHANNTYPAEFIRENLLINANLIHASWRVGVKRFLNLGSSCIYPRNTEQPIKETSLRGLWSKRIQPMPLPKLRVWKCAGTIVHNMEFCFTVRCPRTFMGQEIIIILKTLMSYPLCLDAFMKRRKRVCLKSVFGVPVNQGENSCMLMTWQLA